MKTKISRADAFRKSRQIAAAIQEWQTLLSMEALWDHDRDCVREAKRLLKMYSVSRHRQG
jgi:hypothetical protein